MSQLFKRYFSDESGATAIEYGLIGALVAVAVAVVAYLIGDDLDATFQFILTQLQS